MWLLEPPLANVYRRSENDGEPVSDRRLRGRIASGEIQRIAPGSFADAAEWRSLRPIARHAQRVWEAAARLSPGQTFSHFAAAALYGIDILGPWPDVIDLTLDRASGGRSTGSIRRHGHDLHDSDTVPWGRHRLTNALRTTVDLIASLRLVEAVPIADQALWGRRNGGALVEASDLRAMAHNRTGRGAARAPRAADFATDLADSVRESQSRVLIDVMGFPPPELQTRFVLSNGRDAFTDFFWRDHSHIGEFDGVGKYRDAELLRGLAPEEALIAEKDREDDLRRQVRAFSRWRTPALRSPRALYDILRGAGLPTSRPRPAR